MFFKKASDPIRGRLVNEITGEVITLRDRECSVGRNKACDIVLGFDTISRLHAVIAFRNKGFMIFDTNSKSGVTVNSEPIKKKANIYDGDRVGFGGLEYTLSVNKFKYIKDKSKKIARPGPIKLIAVPAIVWSACNETQAIACITPKAAPTRPPHKNANQPFPVKNATAAPVKAPIVIIPSIPMFTTPLRSEKQEPNAANKSGGVAISVALINNPKYESIVSIILPPFSLLRLLISL